MITFIGDSGKTLNFHPLGIMAGATVGIFDPSGTFILLFSLFSWSGIGLISILGCDLTS